MSMAEPLAWNLVAPGYLEHNLEHLAAFSERALQLAQVGASDRVLDVACGPGSLTLPAAAIAQHVDALDFSEAMLELLRSRLASADVANVTAVHGDGQALPYADSQFDAAFSMFGLLFFPDRAQGFRELRRVLRPGGRAVISGWQPMHDIAALIAIFDSIYEAAPDLAPTHPADAPVLSTPRQIADEMGAAGFDVQVVRMDRTMRIASVDEFVATIPESFAPLTLMRQQLGERWPSLWKATGEGMKRRLGPGPIEYPLRALLGVGTAL